MRLIDQLHAQGLSNRDARHALSHGKITLNGVPTADAARDISGYTLGYNPAGRRVIVGRDPVILWHDQHLAVIYKPAGVLAVDAPGRRKETNIVGWASKIFGAAHPVHRLDEETSGLMLVALSEQGQFRLKADLERHAITRRYLAICRHPFPAEPQTFASNLVRNRGDGKRGSRAGDPAGKHAITHVRLVESLSRDASLVEAQLETGRTHQVRIHLSEAGFPILGDWLYGSQATDRASRRLALHAWLLAFEHPFDATPMQFQAPLADDLEQLRRRLNQPRQERWRH
jgi:RluA family pseudouridine synthase